MPDRDVEGSSLCDERRSNPMALIADVAEAAARNRLSRTACPGSTTTTAALWYASCASQLRPPPYLPRCNFRPTIGPFCCVHPKACAAGPKRAHRSMGRRVPPRATEGWRWGLSSPERRLSASCRPEELDLLTRGEQIRSLQLNSCRNPCALAASGSVLALTWAKAPR